MEVGSGLTRADLTKLVPEGCSDGVSERLAVRSGRKLSLQTGWTASFSQWMVSDFRSSEGATPLEVGDDGGDLCRREESAGAVCSSIRATETDVRSGRYVLWLVRCCSNPSLYADDHLASEDIVVASGDSVRRLASEARLEAILSLVSFGSGRTALQSTTS